MNFAVDESKGADFPEAKHGGVWWSWHGVPPTLLTGHVHVDTFEPQWQALLHGDKANTLEVQGMNVSRSSHSAWPFDIPKLSLV